MKVGDLVEYLPGTTAIKERRGIVLEAWHMNGETKYLCHWNIPGGALKTSKWCASASVLRLVALATVK